MSAGEGDGRDGSVSGSNSNGNSSKSSGEDKPSFSRPTALSTHERARLARLLELDLPEPVEKQAPAANALAVAETANLKRAATTLSKVRQAMRPQGRLAVRPAAATEQEAEGFLQLHRGRILFIALLPFMLGVGLYFAVPLIRALLVNVPSALSLGVLVLTVAVCGGALVLRGGLLFGSGGSANRYLALAVALLLCCSGILLGQRQVLGIDPLPERGASERAVADFQVTSINSRTGGQVEALVRLSQASPDPSFAGKQVRLIVGAGLGLTVGESYRAKLKLSAPQAAYAPWSFDGRERAFFGGTSFDGRLDGRLLEVQNAPDDLTAPMRLIDDGLLSPVRLIFARLQASVVESFGRHLSEAAAPVASAMLAGDRRGIERERYEIIRASGLAHLLAISGLHVGMIFASLFVVMRLVFLLVPFSAHSFNARRLAAIAALIGAGLFVALVGAPVSAQRAIAMLAVATLALVLGRRLFSLNGIALAGFIVLVAKPNVISTAGFQLSFLSVFALIALYEVRRRQATARAVHQRALEDLQLGGLTERVEGELSPRERLSRAVRVETSSAKLWRLKAQVVERARGLGMLCLASACVSMITLPIGLFHFRDGSMVAVVSNLFGIPWTAFVVMPLGLLSLVLMPLGAEGLVAPLLNAAFAVLLMLVDIAAPLQSVGKFWNSAPKSELWMVTLAISVVLALGLVGRWRLSAVPFALLTLGVQVAASPPDLLITNQGAILFPGRGELKKISRFGSEQWLSDFELSQVDFWVQEQAPSQTNLSSGALIQTNCDEASCLMIADDDYRVALSFTAQSLAQDCLRADAVILFAEPARDKISRDPEFQCDARLVSVTRSLEQLPAAIWVRDVPRWWQSTRVHVNYANPYPALTPWR